MVVKVRLAINWKGGPVTDARRNQWEQFDLRYLGG